MKGRQHDVIANVLDLDIIVSEFELQLCYYTYVHIPINTIGKDLNSFIP